MPGTSHLRKSRSHWEKDWRIITPLPRSSHLGENLYKKRTSVEPVNGRLDVSFVFKNHFTRGQQKMKLQVGLALCVMLAMAVGRIKQKQNRKKRSLVKCA